MGEATSQTLRQKVYKLWESDKSYVTISEELSLSYSTVRSLCNRYTKRGFAGIIPDYHNCGQGRKPSRSNVIYRAAVWLKRKHRKWGAECIRLILLERYPDLTVPTSRTLQNWYKDLDLNPHRDKRPREKPVWADEVHDVWQIDAKEQLRTRDGKPASWLSMIDEHSGAILEVPVFPPKEDQSGSPARDTEDSD